MIRLGAYKLGANLATDEAIRYHGPLEAFLTQDKGARVSLADGYADLAQSLK